eukprot:235881_1
MSTSQRKSNVINIEGCGSGFLNGVYIRSEQYQFTKQCVHPHSNHIITLQIRKQTPLHPLTIPSCLCNEKDEVYVISCMNPCIHYYLCIVSASSKDQTDVIQWISVAGLEPVPIVSPIDNIKTYFDLPFINNIRYDQIATIKNNEDIHRKQLVKTSNIHSHFKKYKLPIKSSWIELGIGLKGGQCLKMEINRKYKIWDILREISEMNKGVSPWNIRLKHIETGVYAHYLWQYNLYQIIQLIEYKELNQDILNNKFVFYSQPQFICYFSPYDDTYSYQTKYMPCHDNIQTIQKTITTHEQYLSKSQKLLMDEKHETEEQSDEKEEIVIDDRYKHQFIATRIWDKREMIVYYGDKKRSVWLEECSVGCECWSDDIAGCRIGYIVEHLFNIPLHKQGWIVGSQIIDYFDENAASLIFSSASKLILYLKLS